MANSPDAAASAAPEPLLMSPIRAAKRLGVSYITMRRMLDAGELTFVQRTEGGTRWIEEAELRRWIARHRINAQTAPSQRPMAVTSQPAA